MIAVLLAGAAAIVWIHLLFFRGGFWRMGERDDQNLPAEPAIWPFVVAVVPARNEADVIATSIGSLLAQDYPGPLRVIVVDDNSSDGTGVAASALANADPRLKVVNGLALAPGWTGKVWAMNQGVERAGSGSDGPAYLLFTDADIAHAPDNLRHLVSRAEAEGRVLVSLMARLAVTTWAERLLIPAFVYFFAMLFPFAWVNDRRRPTAAAAGGCMLARREALEAGGGLAAIRAALIDDCALAAALKRQGPIWLGLTDRAWSLRPYRGLSAVAAMVARSAYAQLGFSPWMLAGTVAGMGLVWLAGPALALFADGPVRLLGAAIWLAMAVSYQPMLRDYRASPLWGAALPLIGLLYSLFTVQSAVAHWRGRGGLWKGRAQANIGARAGTA